jgi:hypothetical protein
MSDPIRVDRRTTLKWLAAGLSFSAYHGQALAGSAPAAKGYGTDPDLNHAQATWHRVMTARERLQTALLADLILPGTDTAPAPSALGVHEFIDEWVSAPYPDQVRDLGVIRAGLASIDQEAVRRYGHDFVSITDADRHALLDAIAAPVGDKAGAEAQAGHRFFKTLRGLVVGAYFTTDVGMKDIGYLGNVALAAFPPATEEMLAIIDRECKALGV